MKMTVQEHKSISAKIPPSQLLHIALEEYVQVQSMIKLTMCLSAWLWLLIDMQPQGFFFPSYQTR